jgi:hypothetical protein
MKPLSTILLFFLALWTVPVTAEVPGPDEQLDRSAMRTPQALAGLAEVQGRVETVDAEARRLHITDSLDNPVVVQISPETRIMNPANRDIKLTELRPDDKVRIYYSRVDGSAQQVDRLPTAGGVLLGLE